MPLVGTRDVTSLAADAPLVRNLDAPSISFPAAKIFQVIYEIDQGATTDLLPPALHPTIPPTVIFTVIRVEESPWGAFTLAESRIGCRSGARPRAFSVRAYCDSQPAIDALREAWGYPVSRGTVHLQQNYDRIRGAVETDEGLILECLLKNPEPLSGNDIQYISTLNLARVQREGSEMVRLIQVDPEYVFSKAERGKPQLDAFLAGAWGLAGAEPNYAVSASCTVADITMPTLRYLVDPTKSPLAAVEKV
jgi:hypothetical protein